MIHVFTSNCLLGPCTQGGRDEQNEKTSARLVVPQGALFSMVATRRIVPCMAFGELRPRALTSEPCARTEAWWRMGMG